MQAIYNTDGTIRKVYNESMHNHGSLSTIDLTEEQSENIGLYRVNPNDVSLYLMPTCDQKYIKTINNVHIEMSQEEKAFVDIPDEYKKIVDGALVEMSGEEKFLTKKSNIQSQVNAVFLSETTVLKSDVQQEEVDTFDSQKEEALAYQTDNTAETPLLSGLATVRGLTVSELAVRVLAHASAYKTAMGQIMGKKHAFEDALGDAETLEDLEEIEVEVT